MAGTAGTGAHSAEGVAEHSPRLQYGRVGSVQARCRPPTLVQTSLVLQSMQALPTAVQGVHAGYHGADASHGGSHGLAPPAAPPQPPTPAPHAPAPGPPQVPAPQPPAAGTADATATCRLKID